MWSIVSGEFLPRLDLLDGSFPQARPILERCLQVDREHRYPDATALAADLIELRDDLGDGQGCPELMQLLDALTRDEGAAFDEARRQILRRDSKVQHDSGWQTFVDALPGRLEPADDPFRGGIQPPISALTLDRPVARPSAVDAAEHATGDTVVSGARPTFDAAAEADVPLDGTASGEPSGAHDFTHTAPMDATASRSSGWSRADVTAISTEHRPPAPRRLPPVAVVGVAIVLVTGVLLALWRPWEQDPGAGADADEAAANGAAPIPAEEAVALPTPTPMDPVAAPDADTAEATVPAAVQATEAPTADPGAIEPATTEATDVEAEVPVAATCRVVINSYPWASWRLSGDAEGSGESTPYVGTLPPGSYRFELRARDGEPVKVLTIEVPPGETAISHCWNFDAEGPC
jgi:hypothetical protein